MSIKELVEFFTLGKTAIDMIRAAAELLPPNKKKEGLATVAAAQQALEASKAELASRLGHKLCKCTFPPQIMLWNERRKSDICPNPSCGREVSYGPKSLEIVQFGAV